MGALKLYQVYDKAEIQFSLGDEIGQTGQCSEVFKAHDPQLDAEIAIKKIPKNHFSDQTEYFNESRILYKSEHSNIVKVCYACHDNDYIYIAMPFYAQGSLKKALGEQFLTTREIIRYSLQFLSGLHHVHSKGLIHFDIKLDNILISDKNEAMISDFGLAKPTNLSGLAGQDRHYIKMRPPESFDYDQFDSSFDIYQIGLTLYSMCNGIECFNSQFNTYLDNNGDLKRDEFKFACKTGRFPNSSSFLPHIPKKLRQIIKKCIKADPDLRYETCISLQNDISNLSNKGIDWRYNITSNDSYTWTKEEDDKKVVLEKNPDGYSAKKIFSDGREQRIIPYCKATLNNIELNRFFQENYYEI